MIREKIIFYLGLVLIVSACETLDPKVDIPAYIYVEPFAVKNSLSTWKEDSIFSEKITDVWVYVDNSALQGAYELPAIIPINKNGTGDLVLRAGIKNGGIGTQRVLYPFYHEFKMEAYTFKPAIVDTISPVVYYDNESAEIVMPWDENFDDNIGGFNFDHHPSSDTTVQKVTDPSLTFKGFQSGGIFLDEDDYFFEMISPAIPYPGGSIPVYMELNYKTDHEFYVGLYLNSTDNQIPIFVVKEKDEWNKIYFDFTPFIQSSFGLIDFKVYIGFVKDPSHPTVNMYLDNIKLVHY